MSEPKFYVLLKRMLKGHGRLDPVQGWEMIHDFQVGTPIKANWTNAVHFNMAPEFREIKLGDVPAGAPSTLVVSEKVVDLLRDKYLKNNEVLPVTVFNHKKRKEQGPYFILHQTHLPECIDESQSQGIRNDIRPDTYLSLPRMVLDEAKIDPETFVFRAWQYPALPLVRREVADVLQKNSVQGPWLIPVNEYNSGKHQA